MAKFKIIWSEMAKLELKRIYLYYKSKSNQGAMSVRNDLLNSPKSIHFPHQYQVDDINPKYRRIIVRDYKLLYKVMEDTIFVLDIVSTRQSPEILKRK